MKRKDFNYLSGKKYDGMLGRCYRESDRSYSTYGARGIKVCSEWLRDINVFRAWLLRELNILNISLEDFILNSKKYQLERLDPDNHYIPSNCTITSPQKNTRNRRGIRNKVLISAEGDRICFNHK